MKLLKFYLAAVILLILFSSCARTTSLPFSQETIEKHNLQEKMQKRLQLVNTGEIFLQKKVDTTISEVIDGKVVEYNNTYTDNYQVKSEELGIILPGGNSNKIEVTFGDDDEKIPYIARKTNEGIIFVPDVECSKNTARCSIKFKNDTYSLLRGKYTYLIYEHEQKDKKEAENKKASGRKVGTDGAETKPEKAKKGEVIY